MTSHIAEPAARVEARRRLVEEQHRGMRHEAGREVEPAQHAAGVGLRRPVGRVDEVELLQQLVGALPRVVGGQVVQPADHLEVLPAGELVDDGRRLPGEPDDGATAAASCTTSCPSTPARPPSGCSSVVRMRTAVVLPAPFGPSSPSTLPRRTARSIPRSASPDVSRKDLRQPLGDDRVLTSPGDT